MGEEPQTYRKWLAPLPMRLPHRLLLSFDMSPPSLHLCKSLLGALRIPSSLMPPLPLALSLRTRLPLMSFHLSPPPAFSQALPLSVESTFGCRCKLGASPLVPRRTTSKLRMKILLPLKVPGLPSILTPSSLQPLLAGTMALPSDRVGGSRSSGFAALFF